MQGMIVYFLWKESKKRATRQNAQTLYNTMANQLTTTKKSSYGCMDHLPELYHSSKNISKIIEEFGNSSLALLLGEHLKLKL